MRIVYEKINRTSAKRVDISDDIGTYAQKGEAMENLKRFIGGNAQVVADVADATELVREIERIHKTSAVVTAAIGRLAIGAGLMGYGLKNGRDSVTVRVNGGGPAGVLTAVADGAGHVKAFAENPVVELPLNEKGKLDVGGAVGRDGTLTVAKDLGLKEPYVGVTPLVSGEIAEDIARYYAESEQTATACGLGVLVAPDLTVQNAGGFLVQILPGTPEEVLAQLEQNLNALPSMTEMLSEGETPDSIGTKILAGLNPKPLEAGRLSFCCDCSRERTARLLRSLGPDELRAMAKEGGTARVQCHFCGREYVFSKSELEALAGEAE